MPVRPHEIGHDAAQDEERVARAAAALTELAASALAVLNQLAPLLNRACRGSAIPAEDLAPLGLVVHTGTVRSGGRVCNGDSPTGARANIGCRPCITPSGPCFS